MHALPLLAYKEHTNTCDRGVSRVLQPAQETIGQDRSCCASGLAFDRRQRPHTLTPIAQQYWQLLRPPIMRSGPLLQYTCQPASLEGKRRHRKPCGIHHCRSPTNRDQAKPNHTEDGLELVHNSRPLLSKASTCGRDCCKCHHPCRMCPGRPQTCSTACGANHNH